MDRLDQIKDSVISGSVAETSAGINSAISAGIAPGDIIQRSLIGAMADVGEQFKNGEIYVPEMLIAARAMKAGLQILKPLMVGREVKSLAAVVIGTVKGDLHDIGKNIVSMMLKGARFEIHDIGIDASPQKFVDTLKRTNAGLIAMSSLLTTSMGAMGDTIKALKDSGLRDKVKVMIGGAPITEEFARAIGADGFARDAALAVDLAKELVCSPKNI